MISSWIQFELCQSLYNRRRVSKALDLGDNINFIMEKHSIPVLAFVEGLQPNREQQRIPSVPLDFEYLPVEIISKEFTKLNSTHPYRIHYLGPRPNDTLAVHKRFATHQQPPTTQNPINLMPYNQNRYTLNLQKIVPCSLPGKRDHQYKTTIFYRAFEGMNPTLNLGDEFIFNGAFQSANLDCVIKVQPNEFDLFLRIDSNTRGHTGWYFFSIKNGQKKERVTLNICNMRKELPLYSQGLRPYVFSRKIYEKEDIQWFQAGQNCTFSQSSLRYHLIHDKISPSSLFKLSFQYQFQQQNDQVFFAYCVPYTYSQLQQDIKLYRSSPYVKELSLDRSLSGLSIPLLHITDHAAAIEDQNRKKCIVITGRVHPGQTNGSHMVRGLIQGLLGNSEGSQRLRGQAHIFIVPMLNPDGVVLGNTRTSAAGKDLNRQFIDPDPSWYPQCYHLKQFVSRLQKKSIVSFYIDFHGHSRRKNTFLYGPNYLLQHLEYYKCRLFPKIIESFEPSFRYYSCNFFIPEDKKSTARAVMLSQLKIPYVYTIESSIGLFYHSESMKTLPLNSKYWHSMGLNICQSLSIFNSLLKDFEQVSKERKLDRQKKKQRSISSSGTRLNRKNAEDEFQRFIRCRKNSQNACQLYGMLKQIRLSAIAKPKGIESEDDSDDHDQQEDLPMSKLRELNHLLEKQRSIYQRHRKGILQHQDDIQIIDPLITPIKLQQDSNQLKQSINGIKITKISQRLKRQAVNKVKSTLHRGTKTLDVDMKRIDSTVPKENQLKDHKSVHSTMFTSLQRKQHFKPSSFHKQRYSLATKSLFPVESKQEVLSLPKSLQVMRRQMKKGRLLISNLQESRIKFSNVGATKEQMGIQGQRGRKGPFNPVDPMKVRMVRRSSSTQVAYQGAEKVGEQVLGSYNPMEGLQVDNLAMTIKSYKC